MKPATTFRLAALATMLFYMAGCGGGTQQQNRDFYTSGSNEADQRADQRMAQADQLQGGGDQPPGSNSKRSLYDRLGGQDGVKAIVDDFVTRALDDPRVNWSRKGVTQGGFSIHHNRSVEWDASNDNVKMLKIHLAQFIALATGGPSNYQGKEMHAAHAGMHISNAEFDASVGDLKATLDKFQVPNTEQKELLAIIETTRPQIVEEQ